MASRKDFLACAEDRLHTLISATYEREGRPPAAVSSHIKFMSQGGWPYQILAVRAPRGGDLDAPQRLLESAIHIARFFDQRPTLARNDLFDALARAYQEWMRDER